MNRRNFLRLLGVSPVIPSVLCAKEKPRKVTVAPYDGREVGDYTWKFYINGREVDGSRAVNEHGGVRFPFDGGEQGDVCKIVNRGIFL